MTGTLRTDDRAKGKGKTSDIYNDALNAAEVAKDVFGLIHLVVAAKAKVPEVEEHGSKLDVLCEGWLVPLIRFMIEAIQELK